MALERLAVEGLRSRSYGRFSLAVDELELRAGEATAIMGPNGSGKTTLLRHLAGLEKPVEGSISPDPATQRVGIAFQRAVFLRGSVLRNLRLAMELQHVANATMEARIARAVAAFGLQGQLDQRADTLSGGEAQRANLARALALEADVTLLDEPLTGFDGENRDRMLSLLPDLVHGLPGPAAIVTHSRTEAALLSRQVVVLAEGRVLQAGATAQVLHRPATLATARILGFFCLERPDGETLALLPESLAAGSGDETFQLVISSAAITGRGPLISGAIDGKPITVRVRGELPALGGSIEVSAPGDAVLHYDHDGRLRS